MLRVVVLGVKLTSANSIFFSIIRDEIVSRKVCCDNKINKCSKKSIKYIVYNALNKEQVTILWAKVTKGFIHSWLNRFYNCFGVQQNSKTHTLRELRHLKLHSPFSFQNWTIHSKLLYKNPRLSSPSKSLSFDLRLIHHWWT